MKNTLKIYFISFLLCSVFFSINAQTGGTISGKVTDETGEALIGVSVLVKGTSTGTVTDVDGSYSVSGTQGNTLVFSYIGYNTVESPVTGSVLNISMKPNAENLEEVVVVGYGTQKKSDLTGALSSVKGTDLSKSISSNVTQALQGKTTGVYITSSAGSPGSGAIVRVRGYGSISGATDISPLYVVDGLIMNESQVNQISTADIENLEVLKDASACAIYGSRGANGVILITTKKGKEGKATISLDVSFGSSKAINRVDMMNSNQLYGFLQEAYQNDGLRMPRNITRLYTLDGEGKGPLDENGQPTDINIYDTDWWKETTRTGNIQNYNLSISGGSEKLKSYFGIGYYTESGIIKTSDYERINIRINNEYKFNKYIELGQTLGGAYVTSHDLNMPINEILLPDPFTPVIAPNADKQDPNYEYNRYMPSQYSYYSNSVAVINRNKIENINRNIDGTVYANINLGLKGLYFKSLFGFDIPNYSQYQFKPFFDLRPNNTAYDMSTNLESKYNLQNTAIENTSWSVNTNFDNTLTYFETFGKHTISAMVGYTWESRKSRWSSAQKSGMASNDENFWDLDAGTVNDFTTGSRSEAYMISYLGRINYNYADRYLLTVNIRRDGSSKFARGNRWGTFPSFSLGWRIDQEKFFNNWKQEILSGAKMRVGWGKNGNQSIPDYAYANTVGTYPTWVYAFNGDLNTLQGYSATVVGNPDIKWESVEQTNVGIDLAFLKNSLTLTADYYIKETRDMLFQPDVPKMAGYPTNPWSNAGLLKNKGFEFLIGYRNHIGDFTYEVNANISLPTNKLVETEDGKPLYGSVSKNEIGNPFGRFYGYVYDGIFQTPEEINAHVGADGTTVLQPNAKPGDFRFKNVSNDNILNDDDRDYIGDPNPKIIYGGNINLGYKGIDFSLYFQGVSGNDLWVNSLSLLRGTSMTNLMEGAYTDAWRKAGDNTDIPRISRQDDNNNFRNSSWFVQDGSFCKIKTIQLGYTLPKKWMDTVGFISQVRFYGTLENMFTITKFKYMDPEVPNAQAKDLGIENLQYPNPRKFTIGVNVQF